MCFAQFYAWQKNLPQYKDKTKLQGERLVINGTQYTVKDLARLPPDLAAYKAAQKSDALSIVFHVNYPLILIS